MADRITKEVLRVKAGNVNRLLGFQGEVDHMTDGAVVIEAACGGYKVAQVVGNSGATRNLTHGYQTTRHCADFLDGMREALYIVQGR